MFDLKPEGWPKWNVLHQLFSGGVLVLAHIDYPTIS
jgi:hypothetical protein